MKGVFYNTTKMVLDNILVIWHEKSNFTYEITKFPLFIILFLVLIALVINNQFFIFFNSNFTMKIRLLQRVNPIDRDATPKYYPHIENNGVSGLEDLAMQITKYSSLSYGDILNVLQNLPDAALVFLLEGKSVRLGALGMLRLSSKGEGSDTPKDFNAKFIKRLKVNFTPGKTLKVGLKERATFEIIR